LPRQKGKGDSSDCKEKKGRKKGRAKGRKKRKKGGKENKSQGVAVSVEGRTGKKVVKKS